MLVETEDQRETVTKMQRMDSQTIVDKNNYGLKLETGYFHDDDDDDDDVLFKVLLTVHVIYPYNMNQQDALFSLNLFQ
jgi:hypothetical protein